MASRFRLADSPEISAARARATSGRSSGGSSAWRRVEAGKSVRVTRIAVRVFMGAYAATNGRGAVRQSCAPRPMDIALTRDVSPALQQAELTYLERQPIDLDRAVAQHQASCDGLTRLGLRGVRLPG